MYLPKKDLPSESAYTIVFIVFIVTFKLEVFFRIFRDEVMYGTVKLTIRQRSLMSSEKKGCGRHGVAQTTPRALNSLNRSVEYARSLVSTCRTSDNGSGAVPYVGELKAHLFGML